MRVIEVINTIEKFAPKNLAIADDNIGLIVGDENCKIEKVLIVLDIDNDVVNYSIDNHFDLIITHHSPIFKSIRHINTQTTVGNNILKMIQNGIAVYSAHTNLDLANGGINDLFVKLLNVRNVYTSYYDRSISFLKIGFIDGDVTSIAKNIKCLLNTQELRVLRATNKTNNLKVGVCCGGGHSLLNEAIKNKCDLFISGDFTYHDFTLAYDSKVSLIDIWHYDSEKIILPVIKDLIDCEFNRNLYTEIWYRPNIMQVL